MIKTLTFVPQVEKDNACDRVDASEEQCKAARVNILFFLCTQREI